MSASSAHQITPPTTRRMLAAPYTWNPSDAIKCARDHAPSSRPTTRRTDDEEEVIQVDAENAVAIRGGVEAVELEHVVPVVVVQLLQPQAHQRLVRLLQRDGLVTGCRPTLRRVACVQKTILRFARRTAGGVWEAFQQSYLIPPQAQSSARAGAWDRVVRVCARSEAGCGQTRARASSRTRCLIRRRQRA